jgi:ribosomal protein S18 acetylase RimI-like enzyme
MRRHSGAGSGRRCLRWSVELALDAGCRRLWLVTTNENVDALRFYQRRECRLVALLPGAVDRSRTTLKHSIPEIGEHGIPLRDELVLERLL